MADRRSFWRRIFGYFTSCVSQSDSVSPLEQQREAVAGVASSGVSCGSPSDAVLPSELSATAAESPREVPLAGGHMYRADSTLAMLKGCAGEGCSSPAPAGRHYVEPRPVLVRVDVDALEREALRWGPSASAPDLPSPVMAEASVRGFRSTPDVSIAGCPLAQFSSYSGLPEGITSPRAEHPFSVSSDTQPPPGIAIGR